MKSGWFNIPEKRFSSEPVSKRFSLFKVKEGENFNHRNILDVLRGLKFEPDARGWTKWGVEIGSSEMNRLILQPGG